MNAEIQTWIVAAIGLATAIIIIRKIIRRFSDSCDNSCCGCSLSGECGKKPCKPKDTSKKR